MVVIVNELMGLLARPPATVVVVVVVAVGVALLLHFSIRPYGFICFGYYFFYSTLGYYFFYYTFYLGFYSTFGSTYYCI